VAEIHRRQQQEERDRVQEDASTNNDANQKALDILRSELEEKSQKTLDELRQQLEEEKNLALIELQRKHDAEDKKDADGARRKLQKQERDVRQATENWSIANTYVARLCRVSQELKTSESENAH
jgi:hypothetical protein